MPDLDVVVMGDTLTDLDLVLLDSAGLALDLTDFEVRLFVRGTNSGDLPESIASPLSISGLTWSTSARTVTRASGSFITDGVQPGMLTIAAGLPEGCAVRSVDSATQITLTHTPTASGASAAIRFWYGIVCDVTDATAGRAAAQAIGGYLDLGTYTSDQYRGRVRLFDTVASEAGWTNDRFGVVEFEAAIP